MSMRIYVSTILNCCAATAFLLASASESKAYTFKVIYDFCGVANCTNGVSPYGALLRDSSGNIFGTVSDGAGGSGFGGGVFELSPNGSTWTERVLYALCTADQCPYGDQPESGVIMDTAGNFYATAVGGGNGNPAWGTVFELIPNKSKTKWKARLLYSFCSKTNCEDGAIPNAMTYAGQSSGMLYDGISPLLGTTYRGGDNDGGVAFALVPPAAGKKKWQEKVIHSFCSPNTGDNCTSDGATPDSGMIMDASGNLFGTTHYSGENRVGTIYEISPKGRKWKEITLYSFCSQPACADGENPYAPLILDETGNLLGTDDNVIFKYNPRKGKLTTLYSFCGSNNCSDAGSSYGLTMDAQGDLFGSSTFGGLNESGVIWALNPAFEELYTFCPVSECKDGQFPSSPLLLDSSGNLIGTTWGGGEYGAGEVYELTP